MGGIFPRLPEIQRGLGVAEGVFGLSLIGAACGTLVSLSLAAPVIERFGHRRSLLALTALLPSLYAIASLAGGAAIFFALLVPAGLCIGALEIVVNLEADRVEHRSGRRIMNRAHAFWSAGFFVAGLTGAALSQANIPPQWHLAMMVPMVWLGLALLLGVLAVGTLLVFGAPSPALALTGFALMGVGTSAIFPLAMSAAAQRTDRAAATNVAALAQFSFVAFLLGPPLLGYVAQALGIRWSFGIGLPLVALSFAGSALRSRK